MVPVCSRFAVVLGSLALAASAAHGATFSTTDVTRDFHYAHNTPHLRDVDYMVVNPTYQSWGGGTDMLGKYESISFVQFDLTTLLASLPSSFSAANGDTAKVTFTTYSISGIYPAAPERPLLVGITGLDSVNLSDVTDDDASMLALKTDVSAVTPEPVFVVDEQLVTGPGVYTFDITSLFAGWTSDPSSNFGFALHGRNGSFESTIPHAYIVASTGPDSSHVAGGYVAADALVPTLAVTINEDGNNTPGGGLTAVPEPTTALLLGPGLALLALRRRRRTV